LKNHLVLEKAGDSFFMPESQKKAVQIKIYTQFNT